MSDFTKIINIKIDLKKAQVCANCIHLDLETSEEITYDEESEQFFKCKKMESANGEPKDKTTLAYASDYESYFARVMVHPLFSCRMWEEAE